MKVIEIDNLNRGYFPERLITVSLSKTMATAIANELNSKAQLKYYKIVEDNYSLDLQSLYDVSYIIKPSNFDRIQLGADALLLDTNFKNIEV